MSRERGLELGDFTANRRLLLLIPMAAVVGTMAAFVACCGGRCGSSCGPAGRLDPSPLTV